MNKRGCLWHESQMTCVLLLTFRTFNGNAIRAKTRYHLRRCLLIFWDEPAAHCRAAQRKATLLPCSSHVNPLCDSRLPFNALGGGFVLKFRDAKSAKHLLFHAIGIHVFFINLLQAIPYLIHGFLPFTPHPSRRLWCFILCERPFVFIFSNAKN